MCEDHIGLQRNQLFRERLILIRPAGRKAIVDADIAALRPSEPFEPLPECREACLHFRIVLGIGHQHADAPHPLGLLRARRERPRRRAAEQRDELAPLHSITLSARATSPAGTSMADRLGGLEIDDQFEIGRLLYGKIRGLVAAENLAVSRAR